LDQIRREAPGVSIYGPLSDVSFGLFESGYLVVDPMGWVYRKQVSPGTLVGHLSWPRERLDEKAGSAYADNVALFCSRYDNAG